MTSLTTHIERVEKEFDETVRKSVLEMADYEAIKSFYRTHMLSLAEDIRQEENLAVKLLEMSRCPDPDCDNNGTIAVRVSDDEWKPQQCQWCDEKRLILAARNPKPNQSV